MVAATNTTAAIFAGVAVILGQTNHLGMSLIFGIISVCLFLFALFAINRSKSLSKKQINQIVVAIKDSTDAEYELHRSNVLAKKFQETVDEIGARGFELPGGALNGAIIDLYKKEFSIFAKILVASINKATANINTKGLHSYLSTLADDMLNGHNDRIKSDYKRAADGYFGGKFGDLDLNKHFSKIADHDTKLQIKSIQSANKLNETTTCWFRKKSELPK